MGCTESAARLKCCTTTNTSSQIAPLPTNQIKLYNSSDDAHKPNYSKNSVIPDSAHLNGPVTMSTGTRNFTHSYDTAGDQIRGPSPSKSMAIPKLNMDWLYKSQQFKSAQRRQLVMKQHITNKEKMIAISFPTMASLESPSKLNKTNGGIIS